MKIDPTAMGLISNARHHALGVGRDIHTAANIINDTMHNGMSPVETVRVAVLLADLHQAEKLIRAAHNILEGISK